MTALLIRDPGPATTVQDFGRPDARRWGVPVSGTLVPDWLRLANALVGAEPGAAGLEFRLAGPRFEVEGEVGGEGLRVAAGGPAELRIEGADGARTVPAWTAAAVQAGETVTVGRVREGTTAVLAVSGGIDTPPFLGSRATYARAALGGFEGRALQPGDRLPVGGAASGEPLALPEPPAEPGGAIRVVPGPQDDHFEPGALEALLEAVFTVTDKADRMGMRLSGPRLAHLSEDLAQIVSDGIVPGAIQVPGNGAPIVLLADGQTVGGYPKIATVIGADLPRLARMAPGAELRFAAVTAEAAEDLLRERMRALDALAAGARPASLTDGIDLRRLYETNLVGGVVDVARPDNFPGSLEERRG
jgi:allophanate hydrolase